MAQVPASYFFSSLKPMRWLLVFMFVINLFATYPANTVLWSWWISSASRRNACCRRCPFTLRLVLLVAGTSF
jgi:energy-coupling factor transporter transmembrane protein EcfT